MRWRVLPCDRLYLQEARRCGLPAKAMRRVAFVAPRNRNRPTADADGKGGDAVRARSAGTFIAVALVFAATLGASSASAAFGAESYPVSLVGSGEQTLSTNYGTVGCTSNLAAEASAQKPVVAAALSGTCSAFGTPKAINANGCKVELNPDWSSYSIGPNGCGPISLTLGTCSITIPAQAGLAASYANVVESGIKKVLVTSQVTNLKYTTGKIGCGGAGTFENGTLSGSWLITGTVSGKSTGTYVTSGAQSAAVEAERYPATLSGTQEKGAYAIETEGGPVECGSASFAGSASEISSSVTLTPTYTDCEAFGFTEASVSVNGCSYIYDVSGDQDIACTGGSIVITAFTCEVTISAQTGLDDVEFANTSASGRGAIALTSNVSGLAYTVTKDGFLCPFSGGGARSDGTITGQILLRGSADTGPINIRVGS
jgi:hypothetical protein